MLKQYYVEFNDCHERENTKYLVFSEDEDLVRKWVEKEHKHISGKITINRCGEADFVDGVLVVQESSSANDYAPIIL